MPKENSYLFSYENGIDDTLNLFGNNDSFIKMIEEEFKVEITLKENNIKITGEDDNIDKCVKVLKSLIARIEQGKEIKSNNVRYLIDIVKEGEDSVDGDWDKLICYNSRGKAIKTKTIGQKRYIKAIEKNDIVFAVGPAGTGKTYLAVALAVSALKNNEVGRIILTRPAVEAGESLGFLPGDLKEKIDPYLKPLYDALYDIMGVEAYERNMQRGIIEIAPLAYMRGRTLDNSFIILDEAQNTTPEQMKMFLTRMGFGSKIVVTGDITQMDLPKGKKSGLIQVKSILKGVKGIEFVSLGKNDIVRNRLVQLIINAYERYEESN